MSSYSEFTCKQIEEIISGKHEHYEVVGNRINQADTAKLMDDCGEVHFSMEFWGKNGCFGRCFVELNYNLKDHSKFVYDAMKKEWISLNCEDVTVHCYDVGY